MEFVPWEMPVCPKLNSYNINRQTKRNGLSLHQFDYKEHKLNEFFHKVENVHHFIYLTDMETWLLVQNVFQIDMRRTAQCSMLNLKQLTKQFCLSLLFIPYFSILMMKHSKGFFCEFHEEFELTEHIEGSLVF